MTVVLWEVLLKDGFDFVFGCGDDVVKLFGCDGDCVCGEI